MFVFFYIVKEIKVKLARTGNILLLMIQVKLTGGNDGADSQVAFNNSPIAITFLLLFGILYTDRTGLCAGNSATSINAVDVSV